MAPGLPAGAVPARRPLVLGLVLASLLAASPSAARADAGIDWQDEWGRYDGVDVGVTLGLAATSLLVKLLLEVPHGGTDAALFFDDPLRDALRLDTATARGRARAVSDVTLLTAATWPLVDAVAVAGAARGDWDTAGQLVGISVLSYSVTSLLMELTKPLVRRGRPYSRECHTSGYDGGEDCEGEDRYRSFFSGHSALSFTGASLVCSSHRNLPLYGGRGAGVAACATAMAFATTTALLRVLGDAHYVSDVLVGALVGVLSGFVLPSLLYYGFDGQGPI